MSGSIWGRPIGFRSVQGSTKSGALSRDEWRTPDIPWLSGFQDADDASVSCWLRVIWAVRTFIRPSCCPIPRPTSGASVLLRNRQARRTHNAGLCFAAALGLKRAGVGDGRQRATQQGGQNGCCALENGRRGRTRSTGGKGSEPANDATLPHRPQMLTARLAPDMFPLTRKVQIACDVAKGGAARLSGTEPPDVETTIDELKARIANTLDFVNSIDPARFAGSEDRTITRPTPRGELHFTGLDYLRGFVLPNLHFHVTIAYALLRHAGVEIGKFVYLGKPN